MSTSRRGLVAVFLSVTVVGALGVASTLSAQAGQIVDTADTATYTAPALLPWGARPQPMRVGRPGASGDSLRAAGLVAAPAARTLRARSPYVPKGRVIRNGSVVAPAPTSSASTSKATYFYNVGAQPAATDGFYASVTIAKPTLSTKDSHTLAELAVQSADSQQIVEVGWTVDRVLNGNDDPHLFVYHWINGAETCYNGCGFVQQNSTVRPGDTLAPATTMKFGIQYADDAWWVTLGSEWIGYFPEKLWQDKGVSSFDRSGLVQIFGEVAAGGETPCSQMGNGLAGTTSGAAYLSSVTYTNGPTVTLDIRSTSKFYTVNPLSARTFQYGGPSAC